MRYESVYALKECRGSNTLLRREYDQIKKTWYTLDLADVRYFRTRQQARDARKDLQSVCKLTIRLEK